MKAIPPFSQAEAAADRDAPRRGLARVIATALEAEATRGLDRRIAGHHHHHVPSLAFKSVAAA
jgi:hypothetical protein